MCIIVRRGYPLTIYFFVVFFAVAFLGVAFFVVAFFVVPHPFTPQVMVSPPFKSMLCESDLFVKREKVSFAMRR
jgi:hypothetical protein